MYSYKHFSPGKRANSYKLINYTAQHNNFFPDLAPQKCICIPDKYDKNTIGSDSPSQRVSNNVRISQIINYSKGGKTQYGNFYLDQPLNLNYLGRTEGMPGGSGKPPVNSFR
jgi:hypothetical protein